MIKNIVFDIGNVLVGSSRTRQCVRLALKKIK